MAKAKAPQKPRRSWIYKINPTATVIRCRGCGWIDKYDHTAVEQECTKADCNCFNNVSKVFRDYHPVVVLTPKHVFEDYKSLATATVVPLTSQETFAGLPTSYPLQRTKKNGLQKPGYVLCHNPLTVDLDAFKKRSGDKRIWLQRIGTLTPEEMGEIDQRIAYINGIDEETMAKSWLNANISPDLLLSFFESLKPADKEDFLGKAIEAAYPESGS